MMIELHGEKRRWLLFLFAFVGSSLTAGLVYGWPALRQGLLGDEDGSALSERELGAIFTAGSWSTHGGRFFLGMARDRWGTRIVSCLAILCCAAGSLGIAWSDQDNTLALLSSMLFVGLGSGFYLCMQPLASLFPDHTGAVVCTLSGAFQISGLVFLVLTKISDSRRDTFVGFMFCLLGLAFVAFLVLPRGGSFVLEEEVSSLHVADDLKDSALDSVDEQAANISSPEDEEKKETGSVTMSSLEDEETQVQKSSIDTTEPNSSDEDTGATSSPTLLSQMHSKEYLGLTVWFATILIPLQYYVGSIGFQLEARGDESGFYTDLFSILYAGAAVLSPGAGFLADKFGLGFAQGLSTILVATSLFMMASTSLSLEVHTIGLATYGIGSMLVFGCFYTNVGKRFGYANYGTLAGLGLLVSALASLLQYPLIALASDGNDSIVNLVCGIALVALLPYCVWLARQECLSSHAI